MIPVSGRSPLPPALLCAALFGFGANPALAGSIVLTASNKIAVLDGETLARLATVPVGRFVQDFEATSDGSHIFLATSGGVYGLDPSNWSLVGPLTDRPVQNMNLTGDERALLVIDYEVDIKDGAKREPNHFRTLRIDVATGAIETVAAHDEEVMDLVALRADGPITILDVADSELLELRGETTTRTQPVQAANDEARGLFLRLLEDPISGQIYLPQIGRPGHLWVYAPATGSLRALDLPAPDLPLRGAAIKNDRIFVAALDRVYVLSTADGSLVAKAGLDVPHQQISVSPDGAHLYLTAPVRGKTGAVTMLRASDLSLERTIDLEDISPYAVVSVPH